MGEKPYECGANHIARVDEALKGSATEISFFSTNDFSAGRRYLVFLGTTDHLDDDFLYFGIAAGLRGGPISGIGTFLSKCRLGAKGLSTIRSAGSSFAAYGIAVENGKKRIEYWVSPHRYWSDQDVPRVTVSQESFLINGDRVPASAYCDGGHLATVTYPFINSPCVTVLVKWAEYRELLLSEIQHAENVPAVQDEPRANQSIN